MQCSLVKQHEHSFKKFSTSWFDEQVERAIEFAPSVETKFANMLQYLLGNDCQRVGHNRVRIERQLNQWNKLFERVGVRLKTIYPTRGAH